MFSGLYLRILEFVIAFSLLAGGYLYAHHKGYEERVNEDIVAQAKADKNAQDKYNLVAEKYETLKNTRNENAKTIIKQVDKVVERVVYNSECIDTLGMQLANEAISGRNKPKSSATLPAD